MKHGFIGAGLLAVGIVVFVGWALVAIDSGIPAEWPPSLVSGQLVAVGGWLTLIGGGGAFLWRSIRFTKLFRTGDQLHTRADGVPVLGFALSAVGFTAICWGAVFDALWGTGDSRATFLAVLAPFALMLWLLASVSGLAGRIWWPSIVADSEWVVVSNIFQRNTFRVGQVRFAADNGGTSVRGTPYRRERSPFAVLLRYRGHTVMLPTMRLREEALAALNRDVAPGVARVADPGIVVPPR